MYTLKRFLDTHRISKETFDQIIAKDKDFFDRWIELGDTEDSTTIAPRAIDRLEEILEDEEVPRIKEKKGENMEATTEVTTETSAETAIEKVARELDETKGSPMAESVESDSPYEMEMNTVMSEPEPAQRKRKKKEDSKPRRRRGKNTLTKEFIAEHGQADTGDIKALRMFLMNDGSHKAEDVALMSDAEVQEVYKKDYFVISTETETYIFPRTLLNSIKNEVFVIER